MPHKIDHRRGAVPTEVKFGVGITPFGGVTLAGSQNWFDLLQAANVYSVRRRAEPGYNKINRVRKFQRSKTVEGDQPTETKTIEKMPSERPKACLQKFSEPAKPRIPVINIIRASNESIPGLFISDSSDEESDYEDNDEFVYECPGLAASAEDMTVQNPLFQEKHFQSSYRTPELPEKYWKDVFVESV